LGGLKLINYTDPNENKEIVKQEIHHTGEVEHEGFLENVVEGVTLTGFLMFTAFLLAVGWGIWKMRKETYNERKRNKRK
jgi:hypothetical protein